MKNKLLLIGLILVLVFGMNSCASFKRATSKDTGSQNAEEISRTIGRVEDDLLLLAVQIDAVNNSLQALIQPEQTSLVNSYKAFSAAVTSTEKTAERFYINSDERNEQSIKFFDEWRTQGNTYNDANVQALSEERLGAMRLFNADIATNSVGLKGSLKAYLETTGEISKYFSTDLTVKGVTAMRPTAQEAINDGVALIVMGAGLYAANVAFREELLTGDSK